MIYALSKNEAENYVPVNKTIAIRCLNSSAWPIKYNPLKPGFVASLSLVFDDVNPLEGDIEDCIPFDKIKARSIVRFIEFYKGFFEDIIVHCNEGVSRSCAVGAGLGDFYGFEYDSEIWQRGERGPNIFVYDTLRVVLRESLTRTR